MEAIIKEVTINAPVEAVWQAITDKDEMKHWCFDIPDFEPVVGCVFHFYGGEGDKKFLHICKITEMIPGKKISYTWRYENSKGDSLVTYELLEEGAQTRVKLTHEGVEIFANDRPDFAKENFVAGWNEIIGKLLKEHIEHKQA